MPNTVKKSILGNDTTPTPHACGTLYLYRLCPHGNVPCLWSLKLVCVGRARPLWVAPFPRQGATDYVGINKHKEYR